MKAYMIRKNGEVVHRQSGLTLGEVCLTSDGWRSKSDPGVDVKREGADVRSRWLCHTRWYAAHALYEAWRRCGPDAGEPEARAVTAPH